MLINGRKYIYLYLSYTICSEHNGSGSVPAVSLLGYSGNTGFMLRAASGRIIFIDKDVW